MKKILYILIVIVLFSSCTKQFSETAENTTIPETSVLSKVDKSEYFEAIKKFNWASYDEKPFLYENIFAHECKVFVCDIDEDEIPEIMLTEIYSPREADATEILKFENGEYVSYIDGYVKFSDDYLNPAIKSVDIGEFTGSRSKDIEKMMEILEEDYGITEIPKGYIVHHDVENGILQLVDENIHAEFTHIGGYSIYK